MDQLISQPLTVPAPPPPPPRPQAAPRRARVLCVLPGVPLPTNTGGTIRTLSLLRALDTHFDLTALALHRAPQDAQALRRELRGRLLTVPFNGRDPEALASEMVALVSGRPLLYARYASRALARGLEELLVRESFDLVHFDHLHTAQLAPLVRRLQPNARLVLDEHNVEAQIVERMAPLAAPHMRVPLRWQGKRLRRMESAIVSAVDAVLACSELDAAQLLAMGARCVEVVPNGASFDPGCVASSNPPRDVIFVGSFDWWPNIDAAQVLAREIWPLCSGRLGEARLLIVGRDPPPQVKALAGPRVVVSGRVPSVAPYLRGSRVAAVPLRAGSGTRLKILEAWAYGIPVVTTPLGAEGLPVIDGENALLATEPAAFAEALVRVCDDDALAKRLEKGGMRAAESFHPTRIGERLARFYRDRLVP